MSWPPAVGSVLVCTRHERMLSDARQVMGLIASNVFFRPGDCPIVVFEYIDLRNQPRVMVMTHAGELADMSSGHVSSFSLLGRESP